MAEPRLRQRIQWCYRRLHAPQRKPQPLRILTRWYQSPDGLLFAGGVGSGFSKKLLASVEAQLQKLKRGTCPFINLPENPKAGGVLGIAPAVMQRCQWVKPVRVAQVKFSERILRKCHGIPTCANSLSNFSEQFA